MGCLRKLVERSYYLSNAPKDTEVLVTLDNLNGSTVHHRCIETENPTEARTHTSRSWSSLHAQAAGRSWLNMADRIGWLAADALHPDSKTKRWCVRAAPGRLAEELLLWLEPGTQRSNERTGVSPPPMRVSKLRPLPINTSRR